MKIISIKSILLVALCCAWVVGSIAQPYTLEQCINIALANNLQVRTQENDLTAKRLQYDQARQNLLPTISGVANQSWSWGLSTGADNMNKAQNIANTGFGLNANLILFDGLAMKFNIDNARALANQSEASLKKIRLDIEMNITTMYLQVLLNKQLEAVAQMQLGDTQRKVERSQALVEANRLPQGELYTLQAQAAREENSLVQAQNRTKLSLLDLSQAMELDYSPDFDIAQPSADELSAPLLPDNEQVYQQALNNRPEIRAAQYLLSAQQIGLKTAKAAYSPTLSLGANANTSYYHIYGSDNKSFGKQLGDNFSTSLGLNLTIPIFDRMRTPNNIKHQQLAISNARLQLEQTKLTLRKNIDQAYYNAIAAQSRQATAEKALISAQEAYRYAEQKYDAGRSSTYEYYDAKRVFEQAQSEQLQAQYDYIFKIKILQYYAGTMPQK